MKKTLLLFALLMTSTFGTAPAFAKGGFPQLACQSLTNTLQSAIESMGCTIGSYSGHNGSDEAHKKTGSCHNRGRAIDIESIHCTGDRAKNTKEENLRALAKKLGAYFGRFGSLTHTICYKDIGSATCRPGHDQHLHFGAKESRNCHCSEDGLF